MIKLTKDHPHDRDPIVRIEGRLDSQTIHELWALLAAIDPTTCATFELSGLASLDHDGRLALVRLRAAGHRLVGASLYIHHLLEEAKP